LNGLRHRFGLLRAFRWDSKASLLLQLSDVLLGFAAADSNGNLDNLPANASAGDRRRAEVLIHARMVAVNHARENKRNGVVVVGAGQPERWCFPQGSNQ